jgi:hypothetical protein
MPTDAARQFRAKFGRAAMQFVHQSGSHTKHINNQLWRDAARVKRNEEVPGHPTREEYADFWKPILNKFTTTRSFVYEDSSDDEDDEEEEEEEEEVQFQPEYDEPLYLAETDVAPPPSPPKRTRKRSAATAFVDEVSAESNIYDRLKTRRRTDPKGKAAVPVTGNLADRVKSRSRSAKRVGGGAIKRRLLGNKFFNIAQADFLVNPTWDTGEMALACGWVHIPSGSDETAAEIVSFMCDPDYNAADVIKFLAMQTIADLAKRLSKGEYKFKKVRCEIPSVAELLIKKCKFSAAGKGIAELQFSREALGDILADMQKYLDETVCPTSMGSGTIYCK